MNIASINKIGEFSTQISFLFGEYPEGQFCKHDPLNNKLF
jgi:hypothetical protein